MKKNSLILIMTSMLFSSCALLHIGSGRREQNGCPMTRNIGAEKIMAGDAKALAAAKKARKFKQAKNLTYQ